MAKKPYIKLRRLMEDQEMEIQDVAELAGIGHSTLYGRLNTPESKVVWRGKEIVGICTVLHIPQEKIGEYFFPRVEKGETA